MLDGAAADDPVVGAAAQVQGWLAGAVTALGPIGLLLVLGVLVGLGLGVPGLQRPPVSNARKPPAPASGSPGTVGS